MSVVKIGHHDISVSNIVGENLSRCLLHFLRGSCTLLQCIGYMFDSNL
jgi:hypothetical protein